MRANKSIKKSHSIKLTTFSLMLFLSSLACQFISNLNLNEPEPTSVPQTEISAQDSMVKIFISEGEFLMGDNNGEPNEKPAHPIYLNAFWIDQTEVTNEMYLKCVSVGVCNMPLSDGFIAPKDFYNQPENAKLPVVYVSWNDAYTYCTWANRRLPTEAEWEKAARGTLFAQTYPWGSQNPDANLLNFDNNFSGPFPVGGYPAGASPYGVLDMAGNVWEYVSDWYDENYYSYSPTHNPRGAEGGEYHSVRGGGFFNQANEVRVSFRNYTYAEYNRSGDFGFRCAADYIISPSAMLAPSTR
jgi:eukaryotic-like serine/threonine-protein kinase